MKRYIVPFICILLFPLFVYADMGAPNPRESKVIVSNDNGANLYNWDKELITTIPSDTIIYISYEFTIDGELYAEVYYENEYGMIRLSDVKHFEEKVDPETYSENKSNRKYYSLEETYIYKGPSRAYSKEKKTIPKGEILEYKYYAEKYYLNTEEPAWIYVKYDGVSGWVYTYSFYEQGDYDIESTLVEYVEDGSLITMESDIPVFSDKGLTDQIGKLTLNQEYKIKYKVGRKSYSIKNQSSFCPKYIYKYYI